MESIPFLGSFFSLSTPEKLLMSLVGELYSTVPVSIFLYSAKLFFRFVRFNTVLIKLFFIKKKKFKLERKLYYFKPPHNLNKFKTIFTLSNRARNFHLKWCLAIDKRGVNITYCFLVMDVVGIKQNDVGGTHVAFFETHNVAHLELSPGDFLEISSLFQSALNF